MLQWISQPSRHRRMYRCAHCGQVTTAVSCGSAYDSERGDRLPRVHAFTCGRCGNQTCFDGERQIPAPRKQCELLFPQPSDAWSAAPRRGA
jgi:hypothetical protein